MAYGPLVVLLPRGGPANVSAAHTGQLLSTEQGGAGWNVGLEWQTQRSMLGGLRLNELGKPKKRDPVGDQGQVGALARPVVPSPYQLLEYRGTLSIINSNV